MIDAILVNHQLYKPG